MVVWHPFNHLVSAYYDQPVKCDSSACYKVKFVHKSSARFPTSHDKISRLFYKQWNSNIFENLGIESYTFNDKYDSCSQNYNISQMKRQL